MNLLDLVRREPVPVPWTEGDKIPWNDPAFSARILREHLTQTHDAASRRFAIVDQHIAWIHSTFLASRPARILDLGCGPGLYTSRLAKIGHACVGIDFSPASIAFARDQAAAEQLACEYVQADIRTAEYGTGYDLALFIFGELNVFRPMDARQILSQIHAALAATGRMLLEVSTFDSVRKLGSQPRGWRSAERGLFSDNSHITLVESFWDDGRAVATERYWIIDAATGAVTRYAASTQAYTNEQYCAMLTECGFASIEFHSSFGDASYPQNDFVVITARKNESASQS